MPPKLQLNVNASVQSIDIAGRKEEVRESVRCKPSVGDW